MDLAHASAVVTGGASGLGLATARLLASRGAHVIAADLPSAEAAQRCAESAGKVEFVPTDVVDFRAVEAAVAAATSHGPLRVVVCCAGIGQYRRIVHPTRSLTVEDFAEVIAVNLTGTAATIMASAPVMASNPVRDGDRGVIVCTSSIAAHGGGIGSLSYVAAKAGVSGMTLCAAHDLAEHAIRVMGIEPGFFDTPLLGAQISSFQSLIEYAPHPQRFGRPEEFAALVGQIIDNGMLNGENIRLDAGWRSFFQRTNSVRTMGGVAR